MASGRKTVGQPPLLLLLALVCPLPAYVINLGEPIASVAYTFERGLLSALCVHTEPAFGRLPTADVRHVFRPFAEHQPAPRLEPIGVPPTGRTGSVRCRPLVAHTLPQLVQLLLRPLFHQLRVPAYAQHGTPPAFRADFTLAYSPAQGEL